MADQRFALPEAFDAIQTLANEAYCMPQRQRPTRVSDTLESVIQRFDRDQKMRVYRLWTFWADEVGGTVAKHAEPEGFRSGVLSVRVDTATWMQELQFLKEEIREKLNRRIGEELIRDIYFVSGKTRVATETGQKPRQPAPRRRKTALPKIRDGELDALFKRIAKAHDERD